MPDDQSTLAEITAFLRANAAVTTKISIPRAYAPAEVIAGATAVGDDCAAIPDGEGYLLFAAEGMLESFVADDPWFAGYCAVMVNLSDVAAMGGVPTAIVDVLWTPSYEQSAPIWQGMLEAARAYGVPIVGGHTTLTNSRSPCLAAAVLGKARQLISSFEARPGDDLLMAVDLRGNWRGEKPFWNASTSAPPERLREDLALLPKLADFGRRVAGKDISNGGVVGTLAMLLECSRVGAELRLDRLPKPEETALTRWLEAFPSYGFLLSVSPEYSAIVTELFTVRGIACAIVGRVTERTALTLGYGDAQVDFLPPKPSPTSPRLATSL